MARKRKQIALSLSALLWDALRIYRPIQQLLLLFSKHLFFFRHKSLQDTWDCVWAWLVSLTLRADYGKNFVLTLSADLYKFHFPDRNYCCSNTLQLLPYQCFRKLCQFKMFWIHRFTSFLIIILSATCKNLT